MPILTPEERLGTEIAQKYRLETILGRGGMGVVFGGVHTWTERPVAVKLLHHEYSENTDIAKRFLQEARTASKLKHPNVVDVLDMGSDDGTVYLILELLEGEALADCLHRKGRLDMREAFDVVLPIMDALAMAHDNGIVHRDLKPDNIFLALDAKGRTVPKLLDFGIAKVLHGDSQLSTQTGAIVGTPFYMSPEQVRGSNDLGPAADVWSLGVVLYELLTGDLPIDAETPTSALAAILVDEPKRLVDTLPDLEPPVAAAIDRAIQTDRGVRYPDMATFAGAIVQAARGGSLGLDERLVPRATSAPPPPMRPAEANAATISGRPSRRGRHAGSERDSRRSQDTETPMAWSGADSQRPAPSKKLVVGVLVLGSVLAIAGGLALELSSPTLDAPQAVTRGLTPAARAPGAQPEQAAALLDAGVDASTDATADADAEPPGAEPPGAEPPDAEPVTPEPAVASEPAARGEAESTRRRRRRSEARNPMRENPALMTSAGMHEAEPSRGANEALILR